MPGISPVQSTLNPAQATARPPARVTRRRFLIGAGLASAGLALYSNEIARHELEIVERTFYLRNLPKAFEGMRIAQLSDIHLDQFTEDFFLKEAIAHINALAPDMVLLTGDYCSRGPLPVPYALPAAFRCAELLTGLDCRQRYAILGNHDAVVGGPAIARALENNNTPTLVNRFVPLERGGDRIWLAGLDDIISGQPNLNLALPTLVALDNTPILLLCHEPDYLETIHAHPMGQRVSLVLSGHTHGGQVRLPGSGPLLLPPLGKLYPEGHFRMGQVQLYVNRGLGTVGVPFRLNCAP